MPLCPIHHNARNMYVINGTLVETYTIPSTYIESALTSFMPLTYESECLKMSCKGSLTLCLRLGICVKTFQNIMQKAGKWFKNSPFIISFFLMVNSSFCYS